ncbi:MAG TPA: DUF3006 domain-containing protein [Methanocorpusculum sp.]|nr:DUF3006 domain-containing protein [Methanocorpusculum sp.]HJJ90653.1 DUF3006 domain-containing protein [Methanocorpusculum sp.]HJK01201.1 DUF3006 domain-containing protein [Methanocorpusculum sp.]HJK01686.1 DUF3006 domain-containing protein [Methanocorpusculum sp.]
MKKLLVTVDSIEGEKASILLRMPEEERPLAIIPLAHLPEGVSVGDILSLSFHLEPELTEATRKRVLKLHKKLLQREQI